MKKPVLCHALFRALCLLYIKVVVRRLDEKLILKIVVPLLIKLSQDAEM